MKFLLLFFTLLTLTYAKTVFYCVQLASDRELTSMKRLFNKVKVFPDVRVEKIGDFYVLRAGFFTSKESAIRLWKRARNTFGDSFVRTCDFVPERILIPSYKKIRKKYYTYELGMTLARKYISKKEFNKAEEVYRILLERYPDSREIKVQLARVLYWQGRYNEALEVYREIVDFKPELVDEMRKVEIAKELEEIEKLEEEGKVEEAIERLEKLFYEELEQSYDVGMKLGLLYLRTGQRGKAHRVFSVLKDKYPEDQEIRTLYSRTFPVVKKAPVKKKRK